MNDKIFLASLALVCGTDRVHAEDGSDKMNVLLIMIDDMKPNLGCYGDPVALTPNIDSLAARGTVFLNNFCQQALSGPSRASMLTGLRPDNLTVWNVEKIRTVYPGIVTLPEYFRANGYETAGTGKVFDLRTVDDRCDGPSWSIPFVSEQSSINPAYGKPAMGYQNPETKAAIRRATEEVGKTDLKGNARSQYIKVRSAPAVECLDLPDDAYNDGAIASIGIGLLDRMAASDKPFFLAVGFKRPHLPFIAPRRYWDLYDRASMPLAPFQQKPANAEEIAFSPYMEILTYSDIPPLHTFSDIHENNGVIDSDKQRELIQGYYACISYVDAQVGRVMEALRRSGADKNTVVVLLGDHGWHLGDHGIWAKHTNFEQASHAPLIISYPGAKGATTHGISEFVDLYPTLCSMAGIPVPAHLDGDDLTPVVKEGATPAKRYAVSQYTRAKGVMGYSIRDERYRYTVWFNDNYRTTRRYDGNKVIATELYDYVCDPLEKVNHIYEKEYASVRARMHELLQEHIACQNERGETHRKRRGIE